MNTIQYTKILRSTDGADGAGASAAEEQDPLSMAAGGIDTTFPVLAGDRIIQFQIAACRKVPVKDKPDRFNLEFKIKTTKDAMLNDGRTAHAGFSGFKRISVSTSEPSEDTTTGKKSAGRTSKDIAKDLAMALKACGRVDLSPRQLIDNPEVLDGILVDMKIGINPAKNNFPESNSFSFVIPADK